MLNYTLLSDRADVYICHGILGSGQNWRSFANRLQKLLPNYGIAMIDLRNHGRSPVHAPPHTIHACAKDLLALQQEIGVPKIVIGHSFGGKVALEYARLQPVEQMWMLDSPPGTLQEKPSDQSEVLQVIKALKSVPTPLEKRKDLVDFLMSMKFSRAIANWMTTNLKREELGYVFRFDLSVIELLIQDYFQYDGWALLERPPHDCDIHVVRALNSDRWSTLSIQKLERLKNTSVHMLPRAGHWVHVDNPAGLCSLFTRFFV